jgi:methylmalonyl-CoA/ethylmalonyl-CoA epimerase
MTEIADQIQGVREVALAVEDADAAVSTFETLFGLDFDLEWEIDEDHIHVRATEVAGTQVHCLEPTAEAGPIHSFLEARGEGIHHFCLEVADLDALSDHLREEGAHLTMDEPSTNKGHTYNFLHPTSGHGVLIELIELGGA